MQIIIHRGTKQIGGCVTEISTENSRIFIDLGSELLDENGNSAPETLSIDGVTNGIANCDAVLFTHYHGDHIGMLSKMLPQIPFYMGQASKGLYYILQKHMRDGTPGIVEKANTFIAGQKFSIKDLCITPISVDHSAYDAYMFLIEADGKRILHTGDFRTHGFRGKGVIDALKKYVGQVDVLITEGTMLSRDDSFIMTEQELQKKAKALFKQFKYIFVICSSMNIDRIAAFHEVTPRGKYFVCDEYQKDILDATKKLAGKYSPLYQFQKALVYGNNLKLEEKGFCMPVRSGRLFRKIMQFYRYKHNDESIVIYSMWDGYLNQSNNPTKELLEGFKNIKQLHTSGHATKQAIENVCKTVLPKKAIIPIHSTRPQILLNTEYKEKIVLINDGEQYEV